MCAATIIKDTESENNGMIVPTTFIEAERNLPNINSNHSNAKFEFTGMTRIGLGGRTLRQIRSKIDIPRHNIKAGDPGGYIEFDFNLSPDGDCWVGEDAMVGGHAQVCDNAMVTDNVKMCGSWTEPILTVGGEWILRDNVICTNIAQYTNIF